jgi:alpha-L-fucosidase
MKIKTAIFTIIIALTIFGYASKTSNNSTIKIDDQVRANQIKDMKFGMMLHWSYSTFSGKDWTPEEWVPTLDKDASDFKATGCDTDQWCEVARDAGMGYIVFVAKHHDGLCMWDTKTTEKKVTNSPLGIDVVAKLRKSCDKYGIKLALYYNQCDWNWEWGKGSWKEKQFNWKGAYDILDGKTGKNPELKKAQLKELLTQYGPIEFFWFDHAIHDGGLSHKETVKWVNQFQPDCFVGFNSGESAGQILLRERGTPGPLGLTGSEKERMKTHDSQYLVVEFVYPIFPKINDQVFRGQGGWFYSRPEYDHLCIPAEKIYQDYLGAVKYGNIFSLNLGPDPRGRLRDIDVKTLQKVGRYIRGEEKFPENWDGSAIEK